MATLFQSYSKDLIIIQTVFSNDFPAMNYIILIRIMAHLLRTIQSKHVTILRKELWIC